MNGTFGKFGGRQRKSCPLSAPDSPPVDYKDVSLLQRYVTEQGRILPRRLTGVSAKKQHLLSKAIARARHIALMPYTADR